MTNGPTKAPPLPVLEGSEPPNPGQRQRATRTAMIAFFLCTAFMLAGFFASARGSTPFVQPNARIIGFVVATLGFLSILPHFACLVACLLSCPPRGKIAVSLVALAFWLFILWIIFRPDHAVA